MAPQPKTFQRLLPAQKTNPHPSGGAHDNCTAEACAAAMLKSHSLIDQASHGTPEAQNLLPSSASVSFLLSPRPHLGSGNWPVGHPHFECVFSDKPLWGHSSPLEAWSDPHKRILRHPPRKRFIFRGRDQECHGDLKSPASGDSANTQGDPWSL